MEVAISNSWWACMLLAVPLVLVAVWARIDQGSWFAPGAFFSLVWVVNVLVLLLLAPDQDVWPGVIAVVWIATVVVYVGSIMGVGGIRVPNLLVQRVVRIEKDANITESINTPIVSSALGNGTIFFGLMGCMAVIALIKSEGYGIEDLFSVDAVAGMARAFSKARYGEEFKPPAIVQLFLVFMYASALFGGAWCACATTKLARLLAFFPFLPAILLTLVQTTRSVTLFQIVFWLSAYWGMRIYIDEPGRPFFTKKFILLVPVIGSTAFLGFSMVLLARHGLTLDSLAPIIWPRFRADFIGHLVAFGEWFKSEKYAELSPSFGAITFGGIFEVLGIRKRALGMYEDVVDIGVEEFATDTNIYTVFRGLIEDFTLPGTLAMLFLIGFAAGYGYRMVVKRAIGGLPLLVSFYWFALWSPIAAVTSYNTLIVAYLIFAAYLWLGAGPKLYAKVFSK